MQSLFLDTRVLDSAARERYGLTEELMMENAAAALERAVVQQLGLADASARQSQVSSAEKNPRVVAILCGSGNNGADGYALARRLAGFGASRAPAVVPVVIAATAPKSDLCKLQAERAQKCGVRIVLVQTDVSADKNTAIALSDDIVADSDVLASASVIVDCLFGSGFHGDVPQAAATLCRLANESAAFRIACDVPTGLCEDGTLSEPAFCADVTVTMGALKCSLYSDAAKDVAGQIVCENLGISRTLFESSRDSFVPAAYRLDADDLRLPLRKKNLVNKGSFGHAAIASGEKIGASCIAGQAALRFGAGLVSLVRLGAPFSPSELPEVTPELMTATDFPPNTTAVAFGMGLGRANETLQPYSAWLAHHPDIPCVLDADACYGDGIKSFLRERATGVVLTPHPKEFQSLLQQCGLGTYAISDCVIARPRLIEQFCRAFPGCVLLVKGANPMIGTSDGTQFRLFVNPCGTPALAKAGSGDVLAGLICALLAQGHAPLEAAVQGSLAHALASRSFPQDFSLTPLSLIDAVTKLGTTF